MSNELPENRPESAPSPEPAPGAAPGAADVAAADVAAADAKSAGTDSGDIESFEEGVTVSVDDGEVVETEHTEALVRRAPRYARFLLAGGILGAVVALVLTVVFPANPDYSIGQVFGFLLLICGAVGVALAAVVALLIDRSTAKHAGTAEVEHSSTHPLD